MTTTTRRRSVLDLRRAKAAPGSKHHRPARRFRPRLSGTIPRKGLALFSLAAAVVWSSAAATAPCCRALRLRSGSGRASQQVTEILSVDTSTATLRTPRQSRFRATSSGPSSDTSIEEEGTVRWFNTEKGLGFIARDSGDKDVFVHISAVERSGLTSLSEGDRVIIDVVEGRKALEAARVRLV